MATIGINQPRSTLPGVVLFFYSRRTAELPPDALCHALATRVGCSAHALASDKRGASRRERGKQLLADQKNCCDHPSHHRAVATRSTCPWCASLLKS